MFEVLSRIVNDIKKAFLFFVGIRTVLSFLLTSIYVTNQLNVNVEISELNDRMASTFIVVSEFIVNLLLPTPFGFSFSADKLFYFDTGYAFIFILSCVVVYLAYMIQSYNDY